MSEYGESPIVAPILLFRASNAIMKEDYSGAQLLLRDLVNRFPETSAAKQATRIMTQLKSVTLE